MCALASGAQWIQAQPANKKVAGLSVRAHAWVVGWVPSWGNVGGSQKMYLSHIDVFSLSFSLSSALSKSK